MAPLITARVEWARAFGSAADESAESVAIDRAGHAIVFGRFTQGVAFGTGTLTSAGLARASHLRVM